MTLEELEKLAEDLGDIRSVTSDIGNSLKDAFKSDTLRSLGNELRSSLSSFNKIDKVLGSTASTLDKVAKKEISRKDLQKELNKLTSLESDIVAEIQKVEAKKLYLLGDELNAATELQQQLTDQLSTLQQQRQEVNSVTKGYTGQKNALDIVKDKVGDISKKLNWAYFIQLAIDAGFKFSKISTEIGKNLGYGADNANRTAANLVKVSQDSSNINVTLQNAAEAMNEISTSTGYVAEYSADALETQIMLTKQFGLQAEEAAGIYKLSVLTGKSSKAVNDAMVGAFVATRNQLRVGVPFKATIAEAAKVSGQLAANLQNNPEQIVKAVVQAKALGTTLEQVKGQGEALLNFESSIESELKAELLTGKQLNLERARAAALAGDQVALAEELNKNVGSLEEFQKMNVIQQKTLAEAVGLTADQLAEQLRRQKLAVESGKSLAQITEEEAKQAQERQNAQDKFNLAITKLQDLVGNLVAGPFGQLLDMVSSIATIILKIIQPFVSVAGAILNPILGGISGALGAMTGDDIVGYGARTLITPQGAIALNNNDTVIAGTNLSKGDDVISLPKGSLNLGGSGGSDVVNAIKDLKQTLVNRPAQAFIQGENAFVSRVTTKGVQNTYKSA
jgi:hypothetical protein